MHTDKISVRLHMYKAKSYTKGKFPIILEYNINGVRKKKVLASSSVSDWDPKKLTIKGRDQETDRINNILRKELSDAEEKVYKVRLGELSINDLFGGKDKSITLDKAIEMELVRLEKESSSGLYDKVLALKKQIDTNVPLTQIDKYWFEHQIGIFKGYGNINNTIQKKIKLLRSIIGRYSEQGVSKELRDIRMVTTKSLKVKLTSQELAAIEGLQLPENELITVARDLFLLQIYLRGIRVGDLLQAYAKDFDEGRFTYIADKTGKSISIKLIPQANAIVDRYKGKFDRLFPFFVWLPVKRSTNFQNERARLKHKEVCTTVINKHLKVIAGMCGITKPLSSHIARHTFARMAIDKINNPMITMDLLGHSSLAVHQAYLNDIRKDDELDKAADDIFG